MCGIAGKLSFQGNLNPKEELPLIHQALKTLHHRGPDDWGYYSDKQIWLASTRLSIIDLSPAGHQPMANREGSLVIVFNGEIYNFMEIRKKYLNGYKFRSGTDTEIVLYLYGKYGVNCLKYLRGMFAFAIWDKKKQELFIARDRLGKKPIKYFYNDKFFIFASELKAFIDHPGVPKEIDWEAIDEFLTYQYVPSPRTGFKNIWKLPPAHYMKVKPDGSIEIKRYWDLDFSHKLNLSEEEWMEKITDKLKESVRLRLQSDVALGIHLSGGIDSGMITALACLNSKDDVKTFSIGFREEDFNELKFARLIAKKYHTEHHEVIVKSDVLELLPKIIYQYEEPFADPSILPTWLLMQESKKNFTVALNGDGGDENFAGYRRYQIMKLFNILKFLPNKKIFSRLFSLLYQETKIKDLTNISRLLSLSHSSYKLFYLDLISFIPVNFKNKLYSAEFKRKISKSDSRGYLLDKFATVTELNRLDQFTYVDINTYLPEVLLTKVDIASMAHSLEVRSPFLDHEFMELIAKMPPDLKFRGFTSKYILKKIAEKYLPKECIYRKKQGFVPPLAAWFRGSLRSYLREQLSDKNFIQKKVFNPDAVDKLLDDHLKYKADNAYSLWTILCLKLWMREWFN